ncbi:MAG: hypothetical protein IPJ13_06395 [Saprospiraceae bacterium]|nr:hypothetical protein [Saprospiraceae bacterium]
MVKNKYRKTTTQVVGFGTLIILGWYFYSQFDESTTFQKIGISYILFILFTIILLIVSQSLYDQGHQTKRLGLVSELLMHVALFSILFIPVIYCNKILINIIFRIFPSYIQNSTVAYFIVLFFLVINRYFVSIFNFLVFKYWDSNPMLLANSNRIVNNTSVQQFVYFGIAILLILSQIDKGLYNVFSKEFNEIFIPATVTFIAIERALKSIKIE